MNFRLILSVLIFLLSGIVSTYLYVQDYGIFPGVLYTSATIIVLAISGAVFSFWPLLMYYIAMCATYALAWYLTVLSSIYGLLTGILFAGLGAIASFYWLNRFILKIQFSYFNIFWIGAFSFVLTDLLYFASGHRSLFEKVFPLKDEYSGICAEVFIIWQLSVGISLFFTIQEQLQRNSYQLKIDK